MIGAPPPGTVAAQYVAGAPSTLVALGTPSFIKQPLTTTPWTISGLVLSSGSNRGVFITVCASTSANVNTVTLDPGGAAVALTKLGQARGGGFSLATIWGVLEASLPVGGTYDVNIGIDSNDGMAWAVAAENVRQVLPTGFFGESTNVDIVSTVLTGTWDTGDVVIGAYQSGDPDLNVTFSVTGATASAVEVYNPPGQSDASGAATATFDSQQTNPTSSFMPATPENRLGMVAVVLESA